MEKKHTFKPLVLGLIHVEETKDQKTEKEKE